MTSNWLNVYNSTPSLRIFSNSQIRSHELCHICPSQLRIETDSVKYARKWLRKRCDGLEDGRELGKGWNATTPVRSHMQTPLIYFDTSTCGIHEISVTKFSLVISLAKLWYRTFSAGLIQFFTDFMLSEFTWSICKDFLFFSECNYSWKWIDRKMHIWLFGCHA